MAEKKSDLQDEKIIGVLSYLGFLAIIPYFLKKESKIIGYHARQGVALAIIQFAVLMSLSLLPFFGFVAWYLFGFILNLVLVLTCALSVVGIINVANDKKHELPIASQLADFFKL